MKYELTNEDLNEMLAGVIAAKESGFKQISIDPDHLIEIIELAKGGK